MTNTQSTPVDQAGRTTRRLVVLDPRNIWRVGLVLLGVVALGLLLQFLLEDGGATIFTLLMAWFASIAMEPAVRRLAMRMPRGVATALVMLGFVLGAVLFFALFGRLLVDQIAQLVTSIPDLLSGVLDWVNKRFGTNYSAASLLEQLDVTPGKIASWASEIAGGLIGFLGSVLGSVFGVFTFALFTFYLSADGPRLRRWIGRLFPPRLQGVFATTWDLAIEKTGGYVAARVILATINGSTTALFLWLIGMPYWLPLGIWTGIVAQFVPTIGTYIAIALPVIVGLLSPEPIDGLLALAWGSATSRSRTSPSNRGSAPARWTCTRPCRSGR